MKKENQKKRGLFMRQTNLRIWKRRNWGNGKNGREGGGGGGGLHQMLVPLCPDTKTHLHIHLHRSQLVGMFVFPAAAATNSTLTMECLGWKRNKKGT